MKLRMLLTMAIMSIGTSIYSGAYTLNLYNLTSTNLKYHVDVAGADWLFKEWDGSLAPPKVGSDGKINKVHGAAFSPGAANCFGYVKVTADYGNIGKDSITVDLTCSSADVTITEVCTDANGDGKADKCTLQWQYGKPDEPAEVAQK